MILKGNIRGSGKELARHLMNVRDNEHVELHDLRGFVSDDLHGAMQEGEAIARGTRSTKPFFSLSLNPPENEDVPIEAFETAIGQIEFQLGLENQPRAIVFHEKEGRRHAHCVWSRIDGNQMKAIDMPYYKNRLNDVSRELYLEHGWRLPDGFRDKRNRDPLAFTLEEWQQAKRTGANPKLTKSLIRECWNGSDNAQAFETALQDKGLWLARGDRAGFVAVDWRGEVYSLSRTSGAKAKDLKARLGDPKELLSTDEAKAKIGALLTPKLKAWAKEEEQKAQKTNLAAEFQREQMVQRHRKIREDAKRQHEERWLREEKIRADRTPKGFRGLWGWITGKNRQIRQQNEAEIARAQTRDRAEKHQIIQRQLEERRNLQRQIKLAREKQRQRLQELNRDVAAAMKLGRVPDKEAQDRSRTKQRDRSQDRGRNDDFKPT
ncbi:relaxase [uncultured Roseobacter sp.]|uniref:relaxase/mobilization nuclease domain-containing protein n=1 Tax=uncultured Roseobacter sp. TaxID=114847 RepID=UPI00261C62B4|nr:relaxase [uncultured Roseobacter sp.]